MVPRFVLALIGMGLFYENVFLQRIDAIRRQIQQMNGPDYIVDISGLKPNPSGDARAKDKAASDSGKRRWLAVSWKCCSVYSRIYVNREGTAYEGRCPKCGKQVRAKIGPSGTTARFFQAE